jgi:methylmalonyl-CoA/ethylmalonyl-CoA epimerase
MKVKDPKGFDHKSLFAKTCDHPAIHSLNFRRKPLGSIKRINMPRVKQINHVAVVVDDMEKALSFWRDALGLELHGLRDVPAEKSQVAFLPLPGSEVELVQPTTDDSGIAKYLAKRGPGMHHLCLEVDDIDGMISQLKSKGVRLINEEPRTAADGKKYAFLHPESTSGVLVELYQV